MKCPYCGKDIEEGSAFCGYCGKQQPKVKYCIKCGHELDTNDVFCGYCGTKQTIENPHQIEAEEPIKEEINKVSNDSVHVYEENTENVEIDSTKPQQQCHNQEVEIDEPIHKETVEDKTDNGHVEDIAVKENDAHSNNSKNKALKIALIAIVCCCLIGLLFWGGSKIFNEQEKVRSFDVDSVIVNNDELQDGVVKISEDGTVAGGHTYSPIDEQSFLIDEIKYTIIGNNRLEVSHREDFKYSTMSIAKEISLNGIDYKVTNIGEDAFYGCSLSNLVIPKGITNIGARSFEGCSSLVSITIPEAVDSIGNDAFAGTNISSIVIPKNVKSLMSFCDAHGRGSFCFYGCDNLSSITVDSENKVFDSRDNCNAIIDTESNTLIAGCKNTVIPNSVTSIYYFAFSGCTELKHISIPNSVTYIGSFAFQDCTSLESLFIPNGVTKIGEESFSGCSKISNITLSNTVEWIGESCFVGCTNLTEIHIQRKTPPACITEYGYNPFGDISNSVTLYVPSGTKAIYQSTEPWSGFNIVEESEENIKEKNSQMVYANDPDGWVNVRDKAGANSNILGRLYNDGEPAKYIGEEGNFYKVMYEGKEAYVYKKNALLK